MYYNCNKGIKIIMKNLIIGFIIGLFCMFLFISLYSKTYIFHCSNEDSNWFIEQRGFKIQRSVDDVFSELSTENIGINNPGINGTLKIPISQ